MKILSCHLENFASYKTLDFNFQDQGLTLIHGPTGAGKSTLMDAIPWVLFGVTAKNGKADEICSWQGGVTTGEVTLGTGIKITRVRSHGKNDLYYTGDQGPHFIRGKDLPDTQKLINELLGFNADLYLSGAYLHEFSETSQFFTTTAKNRRAITEQLVDLSLAKKLTEQVSAKAKEVKGLVASKTNDYITSLSNKTQLEIILRDTRRLSNDWDLQQKAKALSIEMHSKAWESKRDAECDTLQTEIEGIETRPDIEYEQAITKITSRKHTDDDKCKECGATKHSAIEAQIKADVYEVRLAQQENNNNIRRLSSLNIALEKAWAQKNPFEAEAAEENPHQDALNILIARYSKVKGTVDAISLSLKEYTQEQTDLDILQDVINQFRSILIENTILSIQDETNSLLTSHFDGEIRIELTVSDADKVDVLIAKDGNTASFTQLSKGQRCLLKLAFGIAVMKAIQQHHAIGFEQIFFDEALDGLDDNFKIKAYGLLQTLAVDYNSIFVVEHSSALKERFENKFLVTLNNGASEIEQD